MSYVSRIFVLVTRKHKILLKGNENILQWAFVLMFDTGKRNMKAACSSYKRSVRSYQDCNVAKPPKLQ